MSKTYQTIIEKFKDLKVLLIGDLMLDSYLYGETQRLCREAPVPIVDVVKRADMAGGAGNTAVNLRMLGAKVKVLSVLGTDKEAMVLSQKLRQQDIDIDHVILDEDMQTLTKQRVISGKQLVTRVDSGSFYTLKEDIEQQIIERLIDSYSNYDAVVVSDYGYGILSDNIIHTLSRLQTRLPNTLIVDSKDLSKYQFVGVTAVKPNYKEVTKLLNITPENKTKRVQQILSYGEDILELSGSHVAAVTLDTEGSIIFERGRDPYRTYAQPVDHSQAAGAGDTYISALTLSLATGAPVPVAAELASAAGSIVVHKDATSTCSNEELIAFFLNENKKITNRDSIESVVGEAKKRGKRIVFTNGCFDILHRGHVSYLNRAKDLGDILIVGVNSDESIKRLKGPERPINPLEDRMHVLAALSSVDYLIPFVEDTPVKVIEKVKPDIFVKGGDYTKKNLPEAPIVEKLGGEVVLLPFIQDKSTTNIIKKIQNKDVITQGQMTFMTGGDGYEKR